MSPLLLIAMGLVLAALLGVVAIVGSDDDL